MKCNSLVNSVWLFVFLLNSFRHIFDYWRLHLNGWAGSVEWHLKHLLFGTFGTIRQLCSVYVRFHIQGSHEKRNDGHRMRPQRWWQKTLDYIPLYAILLLFTSSVSSLRIMKKSFEVRENKIPIVCFIILPFNWNRNPYYIIWIERCSSHEPVPWVSECTPNDNESVFKTDASRNDSKHFSPYSIPDPLEWGQTQKYLLSQGQQSRYI